MEPLYSINKAAFSEWKGVRYNAASGSLTIEALQEAYNKLTGDNMAGWDCSNNKDLTIKKVKNGYIVTIGYDQYVFRTLNQVNKAVAEYFSQQKEEDNE